MIITDVQILGLLLCGILSVIAYKTKIPSIALIPGAGFFILAFDIYQDTESLLLLGLFFALAVIQFVICFSGSKSRR